jgi:two-component system, sensor histidine kinase and response regulator
MSRVLVVDDDADIRQLVVGLLELAGHDASSAPSGRDALAMLADTDQRPHLILLDVQMPDLDGWDTMRAIREQPELAAIPVVFCTVKSSPSDVELGWSLGCDGYIVKPFAIAELVAEIARVLAARQALRR